jgi:dTDP-4-dehydrorhamnose reductase
MSSDLYKSVIITGGGGMLAQALVHVFSMRKQNAVALTRASLDITSDEQIDDVFETYRPTLVLNCAAHTKVDLCEKEPELAEQINGHAVGRLARKCRENDCALVHYSTDFVFDGTVKRPLRPNDPVGPLSVYGKSKLLGETLLRENAPQRWLIVRTAWLYGPGGPCFPVTMLNLARQGKPLKVVDDQIGSPTLTRDLAAATFDLLDRGASGVWHFANSGETSWFGFAQAIFDEFRIKADLTPTSSEEWKRTRPDSAVRPAYSVLDVSPFELLTHEIVPDWRHALRRYRAIIESDATRT